jgi:hypothetical protein
MTHVIVRCVDGRVKEYGLGEKGQLSVKLKQRRRTPVQLTEAFTCRSGGGEKEWMEEASSAITSLEVVTDAAVPEIVGEIPVEFLQGAPYGAVQDLDWEPAYGTVSSEEDAQFGFYGLWSRGCWW